MDAKIVSLKNARTLIECRRLFAGYSKRISAFNCEQIAEEMKRFAKEYQDYPTHTLTLVKGEILLSAAINATSSEPEKDSCRRLLNKIKHEINLKLQL